MLSILAQLMMVGGAYLLGCFNSAYYLVSWRVGKDIRTIGSGNAGATNAARVLGKTGFLIVFLLDFAKGALAVGFARWMGLVSWALAPSAIAVSAGHIWPVQLKFRGGKGIACSLGALLLYDARGLLLLVAIFLGLFLLLRRFILSGLMAYAICPLGLLAFRFPANSVFCASVLAVIVLIAHQDNLRQEFAQAHRNARWALMNRRH